MRLYGLLITKDDEAIFEDWCREQLTLYDAVVCLDGSETDATARIAARFADRLVYLHERDCCIEHRTDHGLRRAVHEEIVRRFGVDNWVMCCHVDEFCYHDPRKVALLAAAGNCLAAAPVRSGAPPRSKARQRRSGEPNPVNPSLMDTLSLR